MEIRKASKKNTVRRVNRVSPRMGEAEQGALALKRSAPLGKEPAPAARGEAQRFDDEFLASVSHELRTPLSAIMIWSTVLLNRTDISPAVREGLEEVKRGADEQQALVAALADFTRIRAGKLVIHPSPTDIAVIVRGAVDGVRAAASEKKIELQCSYGTDLGVVMADPHRFSQAVGNVLNNAVKFSNAAGQVTLAISRRKEWVKITISDTGHGIAAEDLTRVLARFSVGGGRAGRPPRGGLGLGLGIARHLVELHRGEITVVSPGLGRGATFTISVPLPVIEAPSQGRV